MRLPVVLFASAFVVCAARSADACECFVLPARGAVVIESAWKSELVAGRVAAMRQLERDGAPTNIVAIDVMETDASGSPPRLVTIYMHTPGVSCYSYDFRIGREYLIHTVPSESLDREREVFPHFLAAGSPVIAPCGGADPLDTPKAQEALKRLRGASQPK